LELDNKKSGNGRLALTSLRRIAEAALFAAQARRLKTSRGWPLELDNKKSGNGLEISRPFFISATFRTAECRFLVNDHKMAKVAHKNTKLARKTCKIESFEKKR